MGGFVWPPLPKRLPRRPRDMAKPRFEHLVVSWIAFCDVTDISPEDAEEFLLQPGFLDDWERRLDRIAENDDMAAACQRALFVGLAEGNPEAIRIAATPEGKANLARTFPKLRSH